MSEENVNKEAYKQAEKELLEGKVQKVKGYILETLKKLERKKQDKELIEEEIRILKLDLEDLRQGKFDKIEERIENSWVAKGLGNHLHFQINSQTALPPGWNWADNTAGTYNTGYKIYYF